MVAAVYVVQHTAGRRGEKETRVTVAAAAAAAAATAAATTERTELTPSDSVCPRLSLSPPSSLLQSIRESEGSRKRVFLRPRREATLSFLALRRPMRGRPRRILDSDWSKRGAYAVV